MNASGLQGMTKEVAAGLANLLMVAGDNKFYLGHWLSHWAVGAPGLESAVAAAAIAQGHLGQARTLFPFVHDLAGDGSITGPPEKPRARRYNLTVLDDPFDAWSQAVAVLFLVGPAFDMLLRSLDPPQAELARRIDRTLEESRFHHQFSTGRLEELTLRWDRGRARLGIHLQATITETLCWFGPPGEAGVETLREAGVLRSSNEELRQHYLDVVAATLIEHDYDLGLGGRPGNWTYGELPWERWNPRQRRLEKAAT